MPLPIRMAAAFDPELATVPLEDIDPYYANQAVSFPLYLVFLSYSFSINEILLRTHSTSTHPFFTCLTQFCRDNSILIYYGMYRACPVQMQ